MPVPKFCGARVARSRGPAQPKRIEVTGLACMQGNLAWHGVMTHSPIPTPPRHDNHARNRPQRQHRAQPQQKAAAARDQLASPPPRPLARTSATARKRTRTHAPAPSASAGISPSVLLAGRLVDAQQHSPEERGDHPPAADELKRPFTPGTTSSSKAPRAFGPATLSFLHSASSIEAAALRSKLLSSVHLTGPKTAFHHSQVHGGTTV